MSWQSIILVVQAVGILTAAIFFILAIWTSR